MIGGKSELPSKGGCHLGEVSIKGKELTALATGMAVRRGC